MSKPTFTKEQELQAENYRLKSLLSDALRVLVGLDLMANCSPALRDYKGSLVREQNKKAKEIPADRWKD